MYLLTLFTFVTLKSTSIADDAGAKQQHTKARKHIENSTWTRGDMEFIFDCSHRYRTSERSE